MAELHSLIANVFLYGRKRKVGGWVDLEEQPAIELLSTGQVTTDHYRPAAGGDHDRAWLVFYELGPCFPLEAYREAFGRRGKPPAHLRPVREDGERLILGLDNEGIPAAEIARLFTVNARSIRRLLNVRKSPKRGEMNNNTEVLERLDRLEGRVAEEFNELKWLMRADLREPAEDWLDENE